MTLKQEIWQHALVDSASNPDDFVRGAQWMYEKMMKNAVEAEVQWHDGFLLMYDEHEVEDLLLPDIKVGDKVRLAVIKEE